MQIKKDFTKISFNNHEESFLRVLSWLLGYYIWRSLQCIFLSKSLSYNSFLAINETIRSIPKKKLYQELGETTYLSNITLQQNCAFNIKNVYIRFFYLSKTHVLFVCLFVCFYFPLTVTKWNKLELNLQKENSLNL